MAINDDIDALKGAVAAQDTVIGGLNTFIAGLPALITSAVDAQEAGDDTAVKDLIDHITNNSGQISQAVVAGTSAAAPFSGATDTPSPATAPATTYAPNGDIVPVEAPAPAAAPATDTPVTDAPTVPEGETPVPADRVAVDDDHQIAAPAATDAAPDADVTTDPNHVTLEPGETATVDTKSAS